MKEIEENKMRENRVKIIGKVFKEIARKKK